MIALVHGIIKLEITGTENSMVVTREKGAGGVVTGAKHTWSAHNTAQRSRTARTILSANVTPINVIKKQNLNTYTHT